jgi:hypothetical protein
VRSTNPSNPGQGDREKQGGQTPSQTPGKQGGQTPGQTPGKQGGGSQSDRDFEQGGRQGGQNR